MIGACKQVKKESIVPQGVEAKMQKKTFEKKKPSTSTRKRWGIEFLGIISSIGRDKKDWGNFMGDIQLDLRTAPRDLVQAANPL